MVSYDFPVKVKGQEVVAAAVTVPGHWLHMSNFDLLAPIMNFGIFFCYKNSHGGIENKVEHIKMSLAQVLVFFYPLAGEIVQNRHGEPEILCNNNGVEFTHAYAEVQMKHIDFSRPVESFTGGLVPTRKHGVLAVQVRYDDRESYFTWFKSYGQVTDLKCGGVIIGCNFDHRIADGPSASLFFTSWVEIAQSKPLNRLPSFRRSLLHPRRPPQPHQSLDKMYALLPSESPPLPAVDESNQITGRVYHIKSDEIKRLQSEASSKSPRRSKIESFCAFVWQTVAAAAAAVHDHSKMVRMGIAVDGRNWLRSALEVDLENYFGNVMSAPFIDACAGNIQRTSLPEATREIHECVGPTLTAEHFLALIDWVEVRRPSQFTGIISCRNEEKAATADAVILFSAIIGFPFVKMDFGWGGPDFGSFSLAGSRLEYEYVTVMSSASGNGDWIVWMRLKARHLDFMEARAPHVFRRFQMDGETKTKTKTNV